MSNSTVKRGRPAFFKNEDEIAAYIKGCGVMAILRNDNLSYYHKRKLVDAGYLVPRYMKGTTRNRQTFSYVLTEKSCNILQIPKKLAYIASVETPTKTIPPSENDNNPAPQNDNVKTLKVRRTKKVQ